MHDLQTRKIGPERDDGDDAAAVRGQHHGDGDVVEGAAEAVALVPGVGVAGFHFASWILHEGVDDNVGGGGELAPVAGDGKSQVRE